MDKKAIARGELITTLTNRDKQPPAGSWRLLLKILVIPKGWL